jgi:hypothetical protein
MATYREQQLEEQKKKIEDYLKNQDITSEQQRQDYLSSQQPATVDTLGITLNPSEQRAAQERLGVEQGKLSKKQEEGMSLIKMRQKQQNFNRLFNYAYDKYLNAGYNVQQAQNFSTIWANQINEQEFQEEMAAKTRDLATKKQAISEQYGNMISGLDTSMGDPYAEAATRALTGLGSQWATYYLLNREKAKKLDTPKQDWPEGVNNPQYRREDIGYGQLGYTLS